jgi:hypothetical protein
MQLRRFGMVALPAVLLFSTQLFGAAEDTVFQIHAFYNVVAPGTIINFTNSGASINATFVPLYAAGTAEPTFAPQYLFGSGWICVNAYVFDPKEELLECCSCNVSPNALYSLDVFSDLDSNNLNGLAQTSVVVKLLATYSSGSAGVCNPATAGVAENIYGFTSATAILAGNPYNTNTANGLLAWSHVGHDADSAFLDATLSMSNQTANIGQPAPLSEASTLAQLCAFNTFNGTGTGQCKACTLGGR